MPLSMVDNHSRDLAQPDSLRAHSTGDAVLDSATAVTAAADAQPRTPESPLAFGVPTGAQREYVNGLSSDQVSVASLKSLPESASAAPANPEIVEQPATRTATEEQLQAAMSEDQESIASSFYFGSDAHSNTLVGVAPAGSLSPPHGFVQSDGASLRVHTGSIRERNYHLRASATLDGETEYYDDVRSGSISLYGRSIVSRRRMSSLDALGFLDNDELGSVTEGSEGDTSTTRVRMATDMAYNALRIGPANSIFTAGGASTITGHRALSFATSSDPGLPSTASFYGGYYSEDEDIASLIRSDVAVYGGEDVKFPFLPDNFSEFSSSAVYSPGGMDQDLRSLQNPSEGAPSQSALPSSQHSRHRGKLTRRTTNRGNENIMNVAESSRMARQNSVGASSSSPHVRRTMVSTHGRRYRRQSAGEAYHASSGPSAQGMPDSTNIRPNAIMRFFKRISPRNNQL